MAPTPFLPNTTLPSIANSNNHAESLHHTTGASLTVSKSSKKKKGPRLKKPPAPVIPGLVKPSVKKTDNASIRSREIIAMMESQEKVRRSMQEEASVNSLVYSDDGCDDKSLASSLTDDDSYYQQSVGQQSGGQQSGGQGKNGKRQKSNGKKSRGGTGGRSLTGSTSGSRVGVGSLPSTRNKKTRDKNSRGRNKMMWIDDDDMSLASLISEMSEYNPNPNPYHADDTRSAISRVRNHKNRSGLGTANMEIDSWSELYPFDPRSQQTNISQQGLQMLSLQMLSENMRDNDPIARPGAQTAFEGMRPTADGHGMTLEQSFQLGSKDKVEMVPPLLLRPPNLPKVDEHVHDESLFIDNIRGEVRASKGLWERKKGDGDSTAGSVKVDHDSHAGGFSGKEIKMVVKFVDNLGDGDNAGDGTIDVGELEYAFRQGRRTRANAQMEALGGGLVKRFERMLKKATDRDTGLTGVTVQKWFKSCDTSGGGKGDGQVSTKELRIGLANIDSHEPKFTELDLLNFIRYMDPEADGDLGIGEFEQGLMKSKQTPAALKFAQGAGRILGRLEDFMNENNMRIKDLFKFIDSDRSGHITLGELREGLMSMNEDVAAKFAAKKEGLVAARKAKEAEKIKKFQDELNLRLDGLEKTGALNVLRKLDVHMHETGQRIVDLFGKSGFDKSGDGCLGRTEFYKAMKHIGIDCTKKDCRALIEVIDSSGDGEIEAYELEKVVRRFRIDMIYKRDEAKAERKEKAKKRAMGRSGPEIDDSENDFVRMMKEKASKKNGLITNLKKATHDEEAAAEAKAAGKKTTAAKIGGDEKTWRTLPEITVGKIPKLAKSRRVTSGSVLDGSWLASFDKNMNSHLKKLNRKQGVDLPVD